MVCMTCVGLIQSSVIQIVHCIVGLKCFIHLPKCLILSLVFFAYIYISQDSVETHLRFGEIYNKHIIADCPQNVPAKEF